MGNKIQLHHWIMVLRELHQCRCNDIKWLIQSKKYSSKLIQQKQREADKLREVLEGLTNLNPSSLTGLHVYSTFDEDLRKLIKADPNLLGCVIILGPDRPENYQYFSRLSWNIPISFFRN